MAEVFGDRSDRKLNASESVQLWMLDVSLCLASQDCLSEEPFAPERNEPFAIQISGVKCPETHCRDAYLCLAMTLAANFLYAASGTIFLETSSFFAL